MKKETNKNNQDKVLLLQQQLIDLRKELDREIWDSKKRVQDLRLKFEEAKKKSFLERLYTRISSL